MSCTIKDIADALGMSRNTVAKVLSGAEGVSEKTKTAVLAKAEELQYRHLSAVPGYHAPSAASDRGSILFLTRTSFNYSDFWMTVMRGIEDVLKKHGYKLLIGIIDDAGMQALTFPEIIHSPEIKGIILVEICDIRVCKAVLDFHLPTVTVDMPRDFEAILGKMDIVSMENQAHIQKITEDLIYKGCSKFAFAGTLSGSNVSHGFQSRYDALVSTLQSHHLSIMEECCLTQETDQDFLNANYLINRIKSFPSLPDVYICGNDWTAIQLSNALQYRGYRIPEDISIVGFDNTQASLQATPPLTTISSPKEMLGAAAAHCIIDRIRDPSTPYVYSQYMPELILRKSTI